MFGLIKNIKWKYFRIELCFFIFLSYIISFISDLEYSYHVEHNVANFTKHFEYRIAFGTFEIAAYSLFYWGFLKRAVFNKKIVHVILGMAVFLFLQHLMQSYLANWVVSKMPIFSSELRTYTANALKSANMSYSINYPLMVVAFPLIGFTFLIRSLQQDEQMRALKEQQLMSELNYLKAQLHPHFFFNTMNNIYSLALKQSKDTAQVVAKLADMMRYILYEADQAKVSLKKEIDFLSNYVEVERIRHEQNIIQFDIQGINEVATIEPLLLLPFIENAFKHGLEQETGKGFVTIILCVMEDDITLEVSNSKATLLNPSTGIGLQNVSKRLELLYPNGHVLQVDERAETYNVTLTLQLT
ncbi:sensor histidine kinase [Mucilaginibacter calamicampi]|uniref:Sensor histidine kinase n=1 Tax=Mucilaginibacter calamicampi TaxID=1302352 RepID=A0ABW2YUC1_9SPHI